MRVTIDIDKKSRFSRLWRVLMGMIVLKQLPDEIRPSAGGRGYHMIWRGLNMSFEDSLKARKWLGDDANRIKLDKECKRSCKQILFKEKSVKWYENP